MYIYTYIRVRQLLSKRRTYVIPHVCQSFWFLRMLSRRANTKKHISGVIPFT